LAVWSLVACDLRRDDDGVYAQIVLFDGFDPLDATAPFEVLAAGSDVAGGDLQVELVSAEGPRR
jgi:hypothetical protein